MEAHRYVRPVALILSLLATGAFLASADGKHAGLHAGISVFLPALLVVAMGGGATFRRAICIFAITPPLSDIYIAAHDLVANGLAPDLLVHLVSPVAGIAASVKVMPCLWDPQSPAIDAWRAARRSYGVGFICITLGNALLYMMPTLVPVDACAAADRFLPGRSSALAGVLASLGFIGTYASLTDANLSRIVRLWQVPLAMLSPEDVDRHAHIEGSGVTDSASPLGARPRAPSSSTPPSSSISGGGTYNSTTCATPADRTTAVYFWNY